MQDDTVAVSSGSGRGWFWLTFLALALGGVVVAVVAAPWLIGARCPKQIVIAAGNDEAHEALVEGLAKNLAGDGITLTVRTTSGSSENAQLLQSGDGGVALAIMNAGDGANNEGRFETLASLSMDPIWVFYRRGRRVYKLSQLRGKRIAAGAEGTRTRSVALDLLRESGVIASNGRGQPASLLPYSGRQAAEALKRGDIDAAIFVSSPRSRSIQGLLKVDGVQLMDFSRAARSPEEFPSLSTTTIAKGSLDRRSSLPSRDLVLLAPAAELVARKDLHPGLVPALLKAVMQTQTKVANRDERRRTFSPRHSRFAVNAGAKRYIESGPSFLYRYLPFQVASSVDRLKLVLLPFCPLLVALLKFVPSVFNRRIRSRMSRSYRVLREIDRKLQDAPDDADFSEEIATLKRLDRELSEVSVPSAQMQEFYNLRMHTSYMLERLTGMDSSGANRAA